MRFLCWAGESWKGAVGDEVPCALVHDGDGDGYSAWLCRVFFSKQGVLDAVERTFDTTA